MAEGTVAVADRMEASQLGLLASLERRGITGIARSHDDLAGWATRSRDGESAAVVSCDRPGDETLVDTLVACGLPVVVVGTDDPHSLWVRALSRGATGAVHRLAPLGVSVMAIEAALHGQALMPLDVARRITSDRSRRTPTCDSLSAEDTWVLRAVAEGRTVVQIAELIHRSERDTYRALAKLWKRLGVENRSEAIVFAARCGIIDDVAA